MTREEAIKMLVNATYSDEWQGNEDLTTANHMAIEALKREQQLLGAGYQNATVDFYIGGRLFRVREIAQ